MMITEEMKKEVADAVRELSEKGFLSLAKDLSDLSIVEAFEKIERYLEAIKYY